ncbi:MAG TPA: hypothetical protein VN192_04810 [Flavobacterium sp.]|nr:hypothetical protein [Flavobacterium sp.]
MSTNVEIYQEMTENDRNIIEKMLSKAIESHSENVGLLLGGKFDVIKVQLDAIEKQTTKTNGRVNVIESEIQTLKQVNSNHVNNCPNTAKITNLEQMEISRKAVKIFAWSQWLVAAVIVGTIISLFDIFINK